MRIESRRYRKRDSGEMCEAFRWEGKMRGLPTVFRAHMTKRALLGGNIVCSADEKYWVLRVGDLTQGLPKGHWLIKGPDGILEVMSHGNFERSFNLIDDAG